MMRILEKDTSMSVIRSALNTMSLTRAVMILFSEYEKGQAQIWCGMEPNSGKQLRVAYVGTALAYRAHSPEYLKRILFTPDEIQVEQVCDVPILGARRAAEALAKEADLVIVEDHDVLKWQPAVGEWRFFPIFIHMMLRYSHFRTWDDIEKGMYLQKRKIKTFQRNGLVLDVSQSEEDFSLFYDRMYTPMMHSRHPGYGIIHSKESVYQQFRSGMLMLVRDPGGQAVGGGLFTINNKSVALLHTGLLDGDARWYEYGASSALYYHSIRWFFDQQYRVYNAGGCRAFRSDGLYEFKRRWGFLPERDLWNPRHWLFWIPNHSPAAFDWLRSKENVLQKV